MRIAIRTVWLPIRTMTAVLAALVFAVPLASSGLALTINLNYVEFQSTPPLSIDETGDGLQVIMSQAAAVWESIIQDEGTLDIAFYWTDLDDAGGTLALENTLRTSRGKPVEARIRFDSQSNGSDRPWYVDPTPENGSEFNLQQVLVGDLSSSQVEAWYTDTPPATLEKSYAGSAKSASESVVKDNYDLYSIALHELGHAVGLSPLISPLEPLLDNDYDVPEDLVEQVGGTEPFAINVFSPSNLPHIAARKSLMFPSFIRGERRLPGVTDVLAIASAARWSQIAFQSHLMGDMDGDGDLDFDDVDPFVFGLNNPDSYEATYGVPASMRGDMDQNGEFDFDDIALFTSIVAEAFTVQATQAVPEPASGLMLLIGLLSLAACFRRR
ncbi:MAG: PEP-CTERM sorting domain-containing protein [Pirellulales bacterium]